MLLERVLLALCAAHVVPVAPQGYPEAVPSKSFDFRECFDGVPTLDSQGSGLEASSEGENYCTP